MKNTLDCEIGSLGKVLRLQCLLMTQLISSRVISAFDKVFPRSREFVRFFAFDRVAPF